MWGGGTIKDRVEDYYDFYSFILLFHTDFRIVKH